MQNAVDVSGLSKRFGSIEAVADLSFAIPEGSCFGLLGPNGAGKTTTLEILEGLQRPDQGSVRYWGQPLRTGEAYERIGIQFQHTALPDNLTVSNTIDLFASLHDTTMDRAELITVCALDGLLNQRTRALSGGQRQRVLLALALVHDPALVFLDEPTTGLDPQARAHFWELIRLVRDRGKTVVLTTHYMEEAESLCDHIGLLDHGRLVAMGSPAGLLEEHYPGVVARLPLSTLPSPVPDHLAGYRDGDQWVISGPEPETLLKRLLGAGLSLNSLSVARPNLNDLFLKLTGQRLRQ